LIKTKGGKMGKLGKYFIKLIDKLDEKDLVCDTPVIGTFVKIINKIPRLMILAIPTYYAGYHLSNWLHGYFEICYLRFVI